MLTDHEYKILNILRPRVAGEEKFLVRETYPLDLCKTELPTVDAEKLSELLSNAKENDTLKKGSLYLLTKFLFYPNLFQFSCHTLNSDHIYWNICCSELG